MSVIRHLRTVLIYSGVVLLVLFAALALQYIICPVYDFPEPRPFSGDHWYNPYQTLHGNWYKANFHAHSRAWLGVTDGMDESRDVYRHYEKIGYDVIGLSNYQSIQALRKGNHHFFPVYEHGYNIGKRHHLAIGAKRVIWSDYPFWQSRHHKQHLLKVLRRTTPCLVIAHPMLMKAFSEEDFAGLTDYDAVEVLNHFVNSARLWDAALSAGRLVWIVGDDDTHNISDPGQTGVCWTMVNALSARQDDIIAALKAGHMYGVQGRGGSMDNGLRYVRIRNDSLLVEVERSAREILFIHDEGKILSTFSDTDRAGVPLTLRESYVRIEIQNEKSTMYLNPVLRFDGAHLPSSSATTDVAMTWFRRLAAIGLLTAFSLVLLTIRQRKHP